MSAAKFFITVRDGQIKALVGGDEYTEENLKDLGRTPGEVAQRITSLTRESGAIELNAICSSSLDFGEDYGLPNAGEIFAEAIKLTQGGS